MSTRSLLVLATLGAGGFLLYRWWISQQAALPDTLQSSIDQGTFNAQAARMGIPMSVIPGVM